MSLHTDTGQNKNNLRYKSNQVSSNNHSQAWKGDRNFSCSDHKKAQKTSHATLKPKSQNQEVFS